MKQITSTLVARDRYFVRGKNSITHDADPFVIERFPLSPWVASAQNFKSLFRSEMPLHIFLLLNRKGKQIGFTQSIGLRSYFPVRKTPNE
jgi:hypothetical protein